MTVCPENKLIYIYTLSDPMTEEVRYVGKTIRNPKYRLNSHISVSKLNKKKDYCHSWIRSLLNKGQFPVLKIIEETFLLSRETYWIKYYKEKSNTNLTNYTEGGECSRLLPGTIRKRTAKHTAKILENPTYKKEVFIWNTKGELLYKFNALSKVSTIIHVSRTTASDIVSKYIRQNRIYKGEFVFSYTDKFPENAIKTRYMYNKVLFLKNGIEVVFRSAKEASKYISMNYVTLCYHLRNNTLPKNVDFKIHYI